MDLPVSTSYKESFAEHDWSEWLLHVPVIQRRPQCGLHYRIKFFSALSKQILVTTWQRNVLFIRSVYHMGMGQSSGGGRQLFI